MESEVLAAVAADPEGPADVAANECALLHLHHRACSTCGACNTCDACSAFEKGPGQMTLHSPGVKMLMQPLHYHLLSQIES
jgi:hypothetical protein